MPNNNSFFKRLVATNAELNKVSPAYCVAKWQQVTIHLQTGQTHSCHHPVSHAIPISEISVNPSALHNTQFKKTQRKLMLDGMRPAECDYCWRVEDAKGNEELHFSDRIKKSADSTWGIPYLKSSAEMPWDADVIPSYVEVSFSNVCNFGCTYCFPETSSVLMQQASRHGPIKLSKETLHDITWLKSVGKMPIPNKDHNPYIEAWWKWWPELYPKLKVFRITGGEPLLSKETFRTLDWIIANPNPELNLAINTNLGVDQKILDEFFEKCQTIKDKGLVKSLQIFTSCDTFGEHAEYIRVGLDYKKWYYNLWNLVLRYSSIDVTIMCTFNLLSIPNFKYFLNDMLAIRRSVSTPSRTDSLRGVSLDFPYLRYPRYLSALIADNSMIEMLEDTVQWADTNVSTYKNVEHHDGFYPHEIDGLKRLLNVMKSEDPLSSENVTSRHDFYLFIIEQDRRTGNDFLKTFPQLTAFFDRCKQEYFDAYPNQS